MKKAIIIAGLIIIVIGGYFGLKIISNNKSNQHNSTKRILNKVKTSYNFLLLGYGGGNHDGTYLTDSMILAHIDIPTKKVLLISIPRDIWINIPIKDNSDFHYKINALYQIGLSPHDYPGIKTDLLNNDSAGLIKHAVKQITGLEVDNYVAIDFSVFKKVVDILGGIDVNVEKTFDDYEYPIDGKEKELCGRDEDFKLIDKFMKPPYNEDEKKQLLTDKPQLEEYLKNATDSPELAFPCRYEHLHFDKGMTHMDGETALKYVRSRHGIADGGDFGRAARQQRFIEAVKNKVISIGFIPKIIPLINELNNDIEMDIDISSLPQLIAKLNQVVDYKIINFVPSGDNYLIDDYADNGQYILMPKAGIDNWKDVKTGINNIIMGITPTPSKIPSPSKH